jgi:hypothetical protein
MDRRLGQEAFNIAFDDVYGQPPLSGTCPPGAYVARAEKDVALPLCHFEHV